MDYPYQGRLGCAYPDVIGIVGLQILPLVEMTLSG